MTHAKPKKLDMKDKDYQYLLESFKKYIPSARVWAYGSRVKGTAKTYSDLDIVVFTGENQKKNIAELKEELEESSLPFRVDLFVWDEVPEEFRANIKREKLVMLEEY